MWPSRFCFTVHDLPAQRFGKEGAIPATIVRRHRRWYAPSVWPSGAASCAVPVVTPPVARHRVLHRPISAAGRSQISSSERRIAPWRASASSVAAQPCRLVSPISSIVKIGPFVFSRRRSLLPCVSFTYVSFLGCQGDTRGGVLPTGGGCPHDTGGSVGATPGWRLTRCGRLARVGPGGRCWVPGTRPRLDPGSSPRGGAMAGGDAAVDPERGAARRG